jgi:hypothetical protein
MTTRRDNPPDMATTNPAAVVHEWRHVRDGQLASTIMIFDTEARAA